MNFFPELLHKLDDLMKSDSLPFKKKDKENKPKEPVQKVSFEGFWTENFSLEAIKGKWNMMHESIKGDSETAKRNRVLIVYKSILFTVSILLAFLSALLSEYWFRIYQNNNINLDLSVIERTQDSLALFSSDAFDIFTEAEQKAEEAAEYEKNRGKRIPDTLIDVPFYSQKDYPTGCELVSMSMLLSFYGIDLTAEEIVSEGYIEKKDVYLDRYGDPYGPDPDMYFIGDPLEDDGYGCYSGTVIKALKKILPSDKYKIVDLKGWSIDEICREYIDNGIPVLFWGTLHMNPTYFDEVNQWYIDEGKRKGEKFEWLSNEHCMVLVGHDKSYYYFNDPSARKAATVFGRPLSEVRFGELGRQAIAVVEK